MNSTHLLMSVFCLVVVTAMADDLWPATQIVNRPLADVQASVQRYYDINSKPTKPPGFNLFFGRLTPSTNKVGEVGFRFTMCNCAWSPLCCELSATGVATNKTRITVVSLESGLNSGNAFRPSEGTPGYQQILARTKRILKGVIDQLDPKQ